MSTLSDRFIELSARHSRVVNALRSALCIEKYHLKDLLRDGWVEDSMPVCAVKLNIERYEEALKGEGK